MGECVPGGGDLPSGCRVVLAGVEARRMSDHTHYLLWMNIISQQTWIAQGFTHVENLIHLDLFVKGLRAVSAQMSS